MTQRYTIGLLTPEERKRKKMSEPTLPLESGHSRLKMLKLNKVSRELRDRIYRYVLRDYGSSPLPLCLPPIRWGAFDDDKTDGEKTKMEADRKLKTSFESEMVVDADRAVLLYRFPAPLHEEVEAFIYDECTARLCCEKELFPRQREVLICSKRLIIIYSDRSAFFVRNIMPLLKTNKRLQYLRVNFATWPGHLKLAGRFAASMLQRKLDFLAELRVQNVILEANMPTPWSSPVLSRISNVIMGDNNAVGMDAAANVPIIGGFDRPGP